MGKYLDRFDGSIGKRQSEQILKLLTRQRNTGQIRTVEEFTDRLRNLVNELTSSKLKPSLSLFPINPEKEIDSETYNFMLERVEDDLSAGFEESNKIDEVQKAHETIVRDVILKNLRAGVAELESKINTFEFLNKDNRGYDSALFNTFRESKTGRTQRQGSVTETLFLDPRTGTLFPNTKDATIELVGERLVLATSKDTNFYNINSARQIFDSESPQSEKVIEPPGNKLSNILDNTIGTYWIQSLVFKDYQEYVKTKLEFDLGIKREINLLEIEIAAEFNIILESISYIDSNNVTQDINISEQTISSQASIRFNKIATDKLILTFRNENSKKTTFEYSDKTSTLFEQAISQTVLKDEPKFSNISQDLSKVVPSQKIQSVIQSVSEQKAPKPSSFSGLQFTIGLDNIRIGLSQHEDKSLYVSNPLEICGISTIGLRASESRPYFDQAGQTIKFTTTTYDVSQDSSLTDDENLPAESNSNTYFLGSIEYWITKRDINSEGEIIRTTKFPILPLNVDRIYHERLLLTSKSDASLAESDTGTLLFYTNRTDGDIKVYRNGVLLVDQTDTSNPSDGWQDTSTDTTPNTGSPMKTTIKTISKLPGDIFTVSYTPVISTTKNIPVTLSAVTATAGLTVVDMVGDLSARLVEGQAIITDKRGQTFEKSNIYLSIILRQNTAELSLTPAVEEYTLVSGCKDIAKFNEQ